MTYALNEMELGLSEAAVIGQEMLDESLDDALPQVRTAEQRARSRRELERYMEDRALERELKADDPTATRPAQTFAVIEATRASGPSKATSRIIGPE